MNKGYAAKKRISTNNYQRKSAEKLRHVEAWSHDFRDCAFDKAF